MFRNTVSEEVVAIERQPGTTFEDIRPLVAGVRGRAALESGDVNGGLLWAGQTIGLIDDVPSCAELVQRIVTDCRLAIARGATLTSD